MIASYIEIEKCISDLSHYIIMNFIQSNQLKGILRSEVLDHQEDWCSYNLSAFSPFSVQGKKVI